MHSVAFGQMRQVHLDNGTGNNEITRISFYSASSGYVAFTNWIGYTSDTGHTFSQKYITTGNVNFNNYSVNLTFGFAIKGIKAFDQNNIIIYGDYGLVPSILSSSNGGNLFTLVYHSQYDPFNLSTGITDMVFPQNNAVGYAVDADRILKTIDQGLTWSPVLIATGSFFDHLEAADNNNVFAFSNAYTTSKLLKTTNGGTNWQNVVLPILNNVKMNYVNFLDANTGWLNVYDDDHKEYLYKTINGGGNWVLLNNADANPFLCNKMKFLDNNTGYALIYQNIVLKTLNGGSTWEPLPRDNGYAYLGYSHNDLLCLNASQLWAGGARGFLELSTNAGGTTLPKAYFRIDTLGVSANNTINMVNYSRTGYTYKWYRNDTLVGTSYNTTCTHYLYSPVDKIKLVVNNGILADSVTKYQYYNAPALPLAPVISSFAPASASTGLQVSITGSNFTGVTSVLFGGVPASSFTVVSGTTINAIVGGGASGNITVTTTSGSGYITGFQYTTRIKITSVSPLSGPAGTVVTIQGTNFSPVPGDNFVYFGAERATVVSATSTQLMVIVPVSATYDFISVAVNGLIACSDFSFLVTFSGGGPLDSTSFSQRIDSTTDDGVFSIATADLDGDGKPDIVTAGQSYNRVAVLKNLSTTNAVSFQQVQTFVLNTGFYGNDNFVLSDIDGDGKPDILADNSSPFEFCIFRNISTAGNIAFAPKTDITNNYAYRVEPIQTADFNGDGKPEVFGVDGGANIIVFKNTSAGGTFSFTLNSVIHMSWYNSGECKAMDVDGDGKMDIVVVNYLGSSCCGGVIVYRNTSVNNVISFDGGTSFTILSAYAKIAIADIDGDGRADIVATSNSSNSDPIKVSVLRNTSSPGSVSFAAKVDFGTYNSSTDVAADDLNGDGKPDIILANQNQAPVSILENHSTPGNILFSPKFDLLKGTEIYAYGIVSVDINGDGKKDLAVVNWQGSANTTFKVSVFLNSNGSFEKVCISGGNSTITSNLTGASYQWQQNIGTGYANISNNSNFNGVNSMNLQISSIPITWNGYKYRCLVDGNPGREFQLTTSDLWTGAVSNYWENPLNWSCGVVPDANADVIINAGTVIINSNVTIHSLSLTAAVNLSVTTGNNFTITH